jgi:hypothetical protein
VLVGPRPMWMESYRFTGADGSDTGSRYPSGKFCRFGTQCVYRVSNLLRLTATELIFGAIEKTDGLVMLTLPQSVTGNQLAEYGASLIAPHEPSPYRFSTERREGCGHRYQNQ